jgi:hypothetical protein
MDLPADPSTSTSAPPLPYRLQTSGIGWLVAALVLVGLTLAIFARGLRGPAVAVTVVDDAVVGWLAGLVGPGLVGPAGAGMHRLLVGAVHPVVRPDAGIAGPAPLAAPDHLVGRRTLAS